MNIVQQKQFKNMVERILHVPGGYAGGILEMALVCDYHIPQKELTQIAGEIAATLKRHSDVFLNVRLNVVKWIDDSLIAKEVAPLPYVQMGSVFQDHYKLMTEITDMLGLNEVARDLWVTGPKSLQELTRQLKLFYARSKLIIVITDGSYCIGNVNKVKEHLQPFLHRKMLFVQGNEMFTGTQLMMNLNQENKGTVIFDMDGVIFDTESIYAEGWMAAAKEYGYEDIKEAVTGAIGRNAADTKVLFKELLGEDFPYDDVWNRAVMLARETIQRDGLPMMKGVQELLEYLQKNNYRIGLASSTRRGRVLEQIGDAGIADYFQIVVGGDMVEHSKPSPEIYLLACKEMGVSPKEAYAIEDSPNGIRAAHSAGMKALMVPDMIAPTEEIKKICTGIFDDLLAVRNYLIRRDNF